MSNDVLEKVKKAVLSEKVTPNLHARLEKLLQEEIGGNWETYVQIQPTGDTIITSHRLDQHGSAQISIEVTRQEIEKNV